MLAGTVPYIFEQFAHSFGAAMLRDSAGQGRVVNGEEGGLDEGRKQVAVS